MTDGKSIPAEKADISLSDFLKRAPVGTTIVGLDLGDKTIGVAVSDTMHITATALKTIRRASFEKDMEKLERKYRGRDKILSLAPYRSIAISCSAYILFVIYNSRYTLQ